MSKEMKVLIYKMIKYDITIGSIISTMLYFFTDLRIASIFLLGLFIAVINFIASGIILEKSLNSTSWIKSIIFPFTYILRLIVIVVIALPLMHDFNDIISYISGFIMHFPILIISWFRRQKGSE